MKAIYFQLNLILNVCLNTSNGDINLIYRESIDTHVKLFCLNQLNALNVTYDKDPTKKGVSRFNSVSGVPEKPRTMLELFNCRMPSRPSRDIQAQCHLPKVTGSRLLK